MTDATPATPATPTNPEQVNPASSFDTTATPVEPYLTFEDELLMRVRTSLAAWIDTENLSVLESGGLEFSIAGRGLFLLTVEEL